jgi:Family of unknown function (DUF5723)
VILLISFLFISQKHINMKLLASLYYLFWLLIATNPLLAQEQIGLRTENLSGVNALSLNPASMVAFPLKWDLNIASTSFFVENDLAFVRNTNLLSLVRARQLGINYQLFEKGNFPTNANTIFFSADTLHSHALQASGIVNGPAFSMKIAKDVAMGIFINGRVFVGAPDIPKEFNYFYFRNRPFNQFFEIKPVSVGAMAWREVGINYAYTKSEEFSTWSVGGNIKFLSGYEGAGVRITEKFKVALQPNEQLVGQGIHARVGYAGSGFSQDSLLAKVSGVGLGVDVGATFLINDLEEEMPYRAKFGISLIDVGSISFKRSAKLYEISNQKSFVLNGSDFRNFTSVGNTISTASQSILGDSLKAIKEKQFSLSLPSALSLQGDVALPYNFFIGALLVQHLTPKSNPMSRTDILAISPRFDQRWFGAGLPLIWYNWRDFRTGLYARLGFLTIGTDNIGSILQKKDVTGTDFYIGVKINPFDTPWFTAHTDKMYERKGGKRIMGCHEF